MALTGLTLVARPSRVAVALGLEGSLGSDRGTGAVRTRVVGRVAHSLVCRK